MAENSSIQWLQRDGVSGATWNPWISCSHATYIGSDGREHVHPGCLHCYAENLMDTRYGKCRWGSAGNRVVTSPAYWRKPDLWNRKAARGGYRIPVFPSLCDPFEDWPGPMVNAAGHLAHTDGAFNGKTIYRWHSAPTDANYLARQGILPASMNSFRFSMLCEIDDRRYIDWILFTKRPQNIRRMWFGGRRENVTLCYSASNQETLDYGTPLILQCSGLCATVGISLEPMLGAVNMRGHLMSGPEPARCECGHGHGFTRCPNHGGVSRTCHYASCDCTEFRRAPGHGLGWVIVGVESNGPLVGRLGDFKSEAEWWDAAADVVRQCRDAGVPVFLKQGPKNGRIVHDPADFPEQCRVRQFPRSAAVAA